MQKRNFFRTQKGQTATEYVLILAVIVIGLVGAAYEFIGPFKQTVNELAGRVSACVTTGKCDISVGG